eukprot:1483358-Pleurochrysis_carterae.AAC.3
MPFLRDCSDHLTSIRCVCPKGYAVLPFPSLAHCFPCPKRCCISHRSLGCLAPRSPKNVHFLRTRECVRVSVGPRQSALRLTEVLQPSEGDLRKRLSGDEPAVSASAMGKSAAAPNSRNKEVATTPGCTQSEVSRWSAVRGNRCASSCAKRTLASLDSP